MPFVSTRFGSGLSFTGDLTKTAKRPVTDPSLIIEQSDYTISLWVNLDPDQHVSQGILDDGAQVSGGAWGFGSPGGAPQPNGSQLWILWSDSGTVVGPDPAQAPGSWWHHLVAERSGSQITIYSANAVVMTTQATDQGAAPAGHPFQLGTWAGGNALPLFGALDDVAIWNRALTPAERAYLDQHPVPRAVP